MVMEVYNDTTLGTASSVTCDGSVVRDMVLTFFRTVVEVRFSKGKKDGITVYAVFG